MTERLYRAGQADVQDVRLLLRTGSHVFADFGSEDLSALLTDGIVMLAEAGGRPWSGVLLQHQLRSAALPPTAPARILLRGLVFARGRSPAAETSRLIRAALAQLPPDCFVRIVAYASKPWMVTPLERAGFALEDRLLFLKLADLQRRTLHLPVSSPSDIILRVGSPDEMGALAELDAATFGATWHMGEQELITLLLSGRLQVAVQHGRIVGYAALTLQRGGAAHLARLAVDRSVQGAGVGRLLLHDAALYAQRESADCVMLNTQGKNERAQALYRAYGFRPTGKIVPTLVLTSPSH